MNDDLISRSAAIEIIRSMTISLGGKDIFTPEAKESVIGVLDEIEAVDAELVRHGRWVPTEIRKSFGTLNGFKCSLCDKERMSRENYCPNCGAKMDGERNAEST